MSKYYYSDGSVSDLYYPHKALHRADGPAVIHAGHQSWYINGKKHRVDGPATVYTNGYKEWWINGKLHRIDGPAAEHSDGYTAWYIHSQCLTEAEFEAHPERQKYLFEQELERVLNGG